MEGTTQLEKLGLSTGQLAQHCKHILLQKDKHLEEHVTEARELMLQFLIAEIEKAFVECKGCTG